jgi:hypothetical protein
MEKLLKAILFTPLRGGRWGLPAIFLSPPGAAKTDVIKSVAARWNFPCVMLSPGTHGEGAFGVTPVPREDWSGLTDDTKKRLMLDYPPPRYYYDVAGGGIVFLDELLTAPPALQPPMLGFIQERQVGFYKFHPRVRILAASNPSGLGAGGYDVSAPVANRMGWIPWEPPTEDEWGEWMLTHGGCNGQEDEQPQDALAEEARVLAAWPSAYARASGLVTAFHRRRNGLLSACPQPGDPKLAGPWPSHRTWEYATRALASCDVHGLDAVDRDALVGGFVGEGARDEFQAWCDKADLPDPASVLDRAEPWEHDPTRLDRTYAVLSSCVSLVVPEKAEKREARAGRLWEIIGQIDNAGAIDVTEPFGALLTKNGLNTVKEARAVLARERELLGRAGVGGGRRAR